MSDHRPSGVEERELVRRHRVSWRSFPLPDEGSAARCEGIRLELLGTHDPPEVPAAPGCRACRELYGDLSRIASWILREPPHACRATILPFDGFLTLRRGQPRVDVTLSISLEASRSANGSGSPPPDCLGELRGRLSELGASEDRALAR